MKLKHVLYFLLILVGIVGTAVGAILFCEKVLKKPTFKKEYITCEAEECEAE